jgi:hypothetical protein
VTGRALGIAAEIEVGLDGLGQAAFGAQQLDQPRVEA